MTKSNTDIGLLILRLWFGLEMAFAHGLPKLKKLFSDKNDQFFDFLGIGGTASLSLAVLGEFVGGLLIALGLFTRLATIPYMITMFVAAFVVHINDGWGKMSFPLMYLVVGFVLFLTGPGKHSLDQWRAERKMVR